MVLQIGHLGGHVERVLVAAAGGLQVELQLDPPAVEKLHDSTASEGGCRQSGEFGLILPPLLSRSEPRWTLLKAGHCLQTGASPLPPEAPPADVITDLDAPPPPLQHTFLGSSCFLQLVKMESGLRLSPELVKSIDRGSEGFL